MRSLKEFKINDYLSVKLEERNYRSKITEIYVKNIKFLSCSHVAFKFPKRDDYSPIVVKTVDQFLDNHLFYSGMFNVSDEEVFWVVCSNLQVWAENDYNTDFLTIKCSFNLLEKLAEVGDKKAKEVFVKELLRRFNDGYKPVQKVIAEGNLSKYLPNSYFVRQLEALGFKHVNVFNWDSFKFDKKMIYHIEEKQVKGLGFKDHFFFIGKIHYSLKGCNDLEFLYFNKTKLSYLPDSIKHFTKLKELIVIGEGNRYHPFGLKELSNNIINLRSLEKLIISSNFGLELIPSKIGNLKELKFLDLKLNKLKNVPDSIGSLYNVEYLNLSSNELDKLPESLGDLTSLEYLNLSGNKIESIPDSIGNLKNLKVLNLSKNNLVEIPESLGELKSLKIVYLSDNPLKSLPKSLLNLKCPIVLNGTPLNYIFIKNFNKNTRFLKIFTNILEDPSVNVNFNKIEFGFITELFDCLKDESFFQFISKNLNLKKKILLSYLDKMIKDSSVRREFIEIVDERLNRGQESLELGRFFEIIFESKEGRQLIGSLASIEPKVYEILYKIILDFEFSYGYWNDSLYQDLGFLSNYISQKIIEIIENNDFDEFLNYHYCRFFRMMNYKDFSNYFLKNVSIFFNFILENVILWQNKRYDKFNSLELPYKLFNDDVRNILSDTVIKILEKKDKKKIKALVEYRLDDFLNQNALEQMKSDVVVLYLRTIYNVSSKIDDGYRWAEDKFRRFGENSRQIISTYIKEEILRAMKNCDLRLIQGFYYQEFYKYLGHEDAQDLFNESNIIEFLVENINFYDHQGDFTNYFESIFTKVISNDSEIVLKKKILNIIRREKKEEIESIIKLNFIDIISEEELDELFNDSDILFRIVFENYYYDDDDVYNKIEGLKKKLFASNLIFNKWKIALEKNDIRRIFNLWDRVGIDRLSEEKFLILFRDKNLRYLEKVLMSIHEIAYVKKDHRFDYEIMVLPPKFSEKFKDEIKDQIIELVKNQNFDALIPLVAGYFSDVIGKNDIKKLLEDEEIPFFKTVIKILGDHRDELTELNDDFYFEHLKFFKTIKSMDTDLIKILVLSVMRENLVSNYYPMIEYRLLEKIALPELIEILNNMTYNRLAAFLNSLTSATMIFRDYDIDDIEKSKLYYEKLGSLLTSNIKEQIVNIIKDSKVIPHYLWGKFLRDEWDLPLALKHLKWYQYFSANQLIELLTIIEQKIADREFASGDKKGFNKVIRMIKRSMKKPFEDIDVTSGQLKEFIRRLAGQEGCQHKGFRWRCGGKEFIYSRKVLDLMSIPKITQDKLLGKCKEYGGYCDCEILMNSASRLLGEETPW